MNTYLKSFLVFFLLVPAVLRAQDIQPPVTMPDLPEFFVDALSFSSDQPGMSRLDVYVEIPYNQLRFVNQDNVFRAGFEATLSIKDSAGKLTTEKWINEKLETKEYEATISRNEGKLIQRSFTLAPGRYTVAIQLTDNETQKTSRDQREIGRAHV